MPEYAGDPASYPLSTFENGMTGSCLCEAITITITQKDLFTKPNGHLCHCLDCRKSAGTAAANLLILPAENVKLSDPKQYLKTYVDGSTGSGFKVPRSFCSNCGSNVGHYPDGLPKAVVPLGIFPRMPQPEFELFTAHRQEWLKPVAEESKQYRFAEEVMEYM